jgi:hypothetical protein
MGAMHLGFWWKNLRKRDHLEDPDIDVRIILRWIFRKWDLLYNGYRVFPGGKAAGAWC